MLTALRTMKNNPPWANNYQKAQHLLGFAFSVAALVISLVSLVVSILAFHRAH